MAWDFFFFSFSKGESGLWSCKEREHLSVSLCVVLKCIKMGNIYLKLEPNWEMYFFSYVWCFLELNLTRDRLKSRVTGNRGGEVQQKSVKHKDLLCCWLPCACNTKRRSTEIKKADSECPACCHHHYVWDAWEEGF